MRKPRSRQAESSVSFEPIDVPAFLPLWLAGGLAAFVIAVLLVITFFFPLAVQQESRGPMRPLPPSPRLQVSPHQDLKNYDAAKRRELAGGQRPITAAMEAAAKQGWGPPR